MSLLKVSPTSLGLRSGRESCFILFKVVRLPPAKNFATETGALPAARRLTMSLRDEHLSIGTVVECEQHQ